MDIPNPSEISTFYFPPPQNFCSTSVGVEGDGYFWNHTVFSLGSKELCKLSMVIASIPLNVKPITTRVSEVCKLSIIINCQTC